MKNKLWLTGLLIAALGAVSGCGSGSTQGKDLGISLSPSQGVILGGNGSSCNDITTYQASLASGGTTTGATQGTSVAPYRIYFSNLEVQWRNTVSTLTIYQVHITLTSSAISGGTQSFDLDPTEFDDLIGSATSSLNPATTVNSNNTTNNGATAKPSGFYSCPFTLGGLNLTVNPPTNSFSVSVEIQVYGFSTDTSGNESNVRQTYTTTAQYQF